MFVVDATVCPGNFEIASIYMETDQDIVLFQICYNFTWCLKYNQGMIQLSYM